MKKPRIKAILFDMDGTIVDSEPIHEKAEFAVCRQFHIPLHPKDWKTFTGKRTRDIFKILIKRYDGAKGVTVDDLVLEKQALFRKYAMGKLRLFHGFLPLATRLKQAGYRLALVTSSEQDMQRFVFRQLGLNGLFDAIITGDHVRHGKPHPEPYRKAMRALKALPTDCIAIEDADNGILSAKRARAHTIGITNTLPRSWLGHADVVIRDYAQITPKLLERVFSVVLEKK
ncbi:HAD family phosphatase [Candidatus Woesearchaeota archaeon]|nr:HAD family phosphatase [Candidatus Woesearchaeota archaeon]